MADAWGQALAEGKTPTETKPDMGDNQKGYLGSLVRDLLEAEQAEAEAQEALDRAKARVRNIKEDLLPKAFEDMGLDDASKPVVDGMQVSISMQTFAHISAERKAEAFQWLEDNNHGGMIKRKVEVDMGKAPAEEAQQIMDVIQEAGLAGPSKMKFNMSVAPATLKSWLGKEIAAGTEIPMDTFGAHQRRVASVKPKE